MFRSASSILALIAAMTLPAAAADWEQWDSGAPDFRTTYPVKPGDWAGLGDMDDPLTFEFGARYWYSLGVQGFSNAAGSFAVEDTSQAPELHLRITDHSTNVFAKALAGYSLRTTGTYTDPFDAGAVVDGRMGYIGADIGYNAFGDSKIGAGPLVGYLYWNNSPRTNRGNFTTATSAADIGYNDGTGQTFVPMDSEDNNLNIHALRLGLQGKADFGMFDISGEVAAVPYAKVSGILGNDQTATIIDNSVFPGGNIVGVKASATNMDGWGYGAMAEGFVGVSPTENLTVRLGGRAWYLQGTADMTYDRAVISNPSDSDGGSPPNFDTAPTFAKQGIIEVANPFSMLRYGLLGEITYRF